MAASYSYSIATNFSGITPTISLLQFEININVGIVPTCTYINRLDDNIDIMFDSTISAGEKIILDGLVSSHVSIIQNVGSQIKEWQFERLAANGMDGGSVQEKTWTTLPLTFTSRDAGSIITRSGNILTISQGGYYIDIQSIFFKTKGTRLRFRNITDNAITLTSLSYYIFGPNKSSSMNVNLQGYFTVVDNPKTFEIQYWAEKNTWGGGGLGKASGAIDEKYTICRILKL